MDKIILASGLDFDSDFCVEAGGRLIMTVYGLDLKSAVDLLTDSRETKTIVNRHANGHEVAHDGFTRLTAIATEGDHIRLTLEVDK